MSALDVDFSDRFWGHICAFRRWFPILLTLCSVLLLAILGSLAVAEPGSASYVIAIVDVGLLSLGIVLTLIFIRGCTRFHTEE